MTLPYYSFYVNQVSVNFSIHSVNSLNKNRKRIFVEEHISETIIVLFDMEK